ncbi:MAG: hypothetical protein JO161_09560, partial [Planctomycetaceae bacterium]|nr:hypothetical protein [Planctomycetaceae bacterium]
MSLIAPVLLLLTQAGGFTHPTTPASGYRPSGSPLELVDLGLLARLRDSAVQPLCFGFHARAGDKYEGSSGASSTRRVENGDSVLAELNGPGILQRLWFIPASVAKYGSLDDKRDHLRIYIDAQEQPELDVPLESIF